MEKRMKVLTFSHVLDPTNLKLGLLIDNIVIDLPVARTWAQGARNLPAENLPETMYELIFRGSEYLGYINQLIQVCGGKISCASKDLTIWQSDILKTRSGFFHLCHG
jgi:hypothetical protein